MKNWFYALSSREQKLVIATTTVAVLFGFYFGAQLFFASDPGTEVSEATAARFQDVLEKIDNVDQQKTTNLNLKKRMGNNNGVFVSENELGKLFAELEKTAGQSGIQLKGTSQNTNTKAKPFPSVELRMNMECQFTQLIQFLTQLKSAGILLQPGSMKVQLKDPNQPNLDVQMTVVTFLLNQPPLIGAKS